MIQMTDQTKTAFVSHSSSVTENHRIITVVCDGTSITTTVTSTPSVVRKWIHTTLHLSRNHLHRLIVGLGVQWTPPHNHHHHHNKYNTASPAATLQLCVGRRCLIFQLLHASSVPNRLRRFLSHPNNTFVGFWNHSDCNRLRWSKHELEMECPPLDLRKHAWRLTGQRMNGASRESIVKECLGFEVDCFDKSVTCSDWDDEYLDFSQVVYACADAFVAFEIGILLKAWEISPLIL